MNTIEKLKNRVIKKPDMTAQLEKAYEDAIRNYNETEDDDLQDGFYYKSLSAKAFLQYFRKQKIK